MLRAILIHKNLNENNQLFSEEHLFVDFENEEIENRLSSGGYSENGYDTTSFVGLGIINNPPKSDGEQNDFVAHAGICPVCQSNIQLSMYSGEGKGSGVSPDGEHNPTNSAITFDNIGQFLLVASEAGVKASIARKIYNRAVAQLH